MRMVLIVEDEPLLRTGMARGLSKLPGIEVAECGDLETALRTIDEKVPALILSDIDLPGRCGLELIGELGRRGLHTPTIFISAYLKAYQAQIPRNAGVRVLEKPIPLDELRSLVQEYVGEKPDEELPPFTLIDYLQLACMSRYSVLIELREHDRVAASLVVVSGTLWSARDSQGEGIDAFRRMAFSQGQAHCRALEEDPGAQNIHAAWETLLLDTARIADEGAAGDEEFDTVIETALEAMLSKDYATAARRFLEAAKISPDDGRVKANLRRLRELGHVQDWVEQ